MQTSEQEPGTAGGMPWLKSYPEAIDWAIDVPDRPVFDFLYDTCAQYGARPAFDFMGKKWTWAEIGALADRMARGLQLQGVGKGSKVGLFLPNSPYFVIAYYAILRAGGTVVKTD